MSRRLPRQVYVRRRIVAGLVAAAVVVGVPLAAVNLLGDDDTPGSVTGATDTGGTDAPSTDGSTTDPVAPATSVDGSTPDAVTSSPPGDPGTTGSPATTGSNAPVTTLVPPPTVDAVSYAVYDLTTGAWLAESNADEARPVGSLMKLLTAHVVMAAGEPDKVVTVPLLQTDPMESQIGLYAGEQLPRDVLLRAMLIVSANDAARVLARDIAGSEEAFVQLMNVAAADLGLTATRAANPTGLDADGATSSARDVVTLGALLMEDPEFRTTVARRDARLHGMTFPATNDLLSSYEGADGIKTGTTTAAGWCLLGSATRDGRTVMVAVIGSSGNPARIAAATSLLDWAFANT